MKITIAALAAPAALALAPVGALAQHVDVGPGGLSIHGDHHHDVEHTHGTVVHDEGDDLRCEQVPIVAVSEDAQHARLTGVWRWP
ncbi:hypothetical protein [Methylobacterium nigriterrae]|uniref:hypothetical protein n=1 Tax=Methylobacterium nigriterrae TaxID=3127512 RepID=UPI003013AE1E